MHETRRSPVSLVTTVSAAVFPSEPGAPPGHSGIAAGGSLAEMDADMTSAANTTLWLLKESPCKVS